MQHQGKVLERLEGGGGEQPDGPTVRAMFRYVGTSSEFHALIARPVGESRNLKLQWRVSLGITLPES
jgi:hypothetical protein